jgi:hypothetical protein
MMKKLVNIFLVLPLLFSAGCVNDPDTVREEINSPVNIRMMEKIPGRTFSLLCATEEEYHCMNYSLNRYVQTAGRTISVLFTDVSLSGFCLTALGPATAEINLGKLSPGEYSLQFTIKNTFFETALTVTEHSYFINDQSAEWIKIKTPGLNKIPANTVWGYIGYNEDSLKATADLFIDSLKSIGAVEGNFNEGYYHYFSVDSAGNIIPPLNLGHRNLMPFLFRYSGSEEELKNVVKHFGLTTPLWINLNDDKGNEFYSWVLANEP